MQRAARLIRRKPSPLDTGGHGTGQRFGEWPNAQSAKCLHSQPLAGLTGGDGGIRTLGTVSRTTL